MSGIACLEGNRRCYGVMTSDIKQGFFSFFFDSRFGVVRLRYPVTAMHVADGKTVQFNLLF